MAALGLFFGSEDGNEIKGVTVTEGKSNNIIAKFYGTSRAS